MESEDSRDYLHPYEQAVEAHGAELPALLLTSTAAQHKRFAVLASIVAFADKRIADMGSGRADMLVWLRDNSVAYRGYVGVEAVPAFDAFARGRAEGEGLREATFVEADFVQDAGLCERLARDHDLDVIVFSGSLNTLGESDALAVLERAWRSIRHKPGSALAFNFLAGGGEWPRPPTELPRRDSARWVAWALERTPLVTFCQYYLGAHDGTIVMLVPADEPGR